MVKNIFDSELEWKEYKNDEKSSESSDLDNLTI
jgi:hypothetical protein